MIFIMLTMINDANL